MVSIRMVRFSCFHAQIHSHKHKKTVRMSAEEMHKSHSQNHSLKDFSYYEATSPPKMMSESNAVEIYAGHVNERGCNSEEIEDDYKSECDASVERKTANLKKCMSLGSGLGWERRVCDDYDSEDYSHQRFSFDGSDGAKVVDNFQEVKVNSDSTNTESISLIGDQKQSEREEEEEECENYGFHQSGSAQHIVKSSSLPNMHSTAQHFTPMAPNPRSAEDLIVLETRKEVKMDGVGKHAMQDEMNMQENINGASLFCQLKELPSKDYRLKRIEEWVTNLQEYDPPEETNESAIPDNGHEKIHKDKAFNGSSLGKLDGKVNPSMEAVKKYLSSLSASATSIQLVNHGLVVIPFLSTFLSLKALNLSGNAIVKITAGTLPRGLHILNLSRNNISTVEGLRELTRLRVLDLSYNRILRIGHGLAYCSSLKELYLAGNKISEVEGLHRLLKLNVLDLRFNKISTAKSLGQLAANYNSLQAISLEGNPAQKNVGHEQLKKHLQSLVPHLTYYNGQSIKIGTLKDASDRSSRLGIGSHQVDRGVKTELKVVRKSHATAPLKVSKNSRHGHPGPSAARRSSRHHHVGDSKNKVVTSLGPDLAMRRSRSEGTLGPL